MTQKKSRAETVEHVAKMLKQKADLAYSEIVKEAKAAGHHVYPLIVGLAKKTLGIGRPKKAAKRGRPAGKKGRPAKVGRPRGRPAGAKAGRPGGRPAGRGFSAELMRGLGRMQDDVQAMRQSLREIAKLASRF